MSGTKSDESVVAPPTPATNGAGWELDPAVIPNLDDIVTEDGKPVDNLYVERLYKLLVESLYASWRPPGAPGRPFLAAANVGWFPVWKEPAIVPDFFLSLDVRQRDPGTREGRSYFQWVYGKPPDLVIEVVSDTRADEGGAKMREYQRLCLPYYIIHDPDNILDGGVLRAYELRGRRYAPIDPAWIEDLGLGLRMWEGTLYELTRSWLRWCDQQGQVTPTGLELAARQTQRADAAEERVHDAEERIRRLHAQLRAQGIEPEA